KKVQREMTVASFSGNVTIGNIILNEQEVSKDAAVFSIEAEAGVTTTFEKTRKITREVGFSNKITRVGMGDQLGGKLELNLGILKAEASSEIKKAVEKAINETLTDSEEYKQTITIDGSKIRKAKVYWIDVYRTGTVQVTQNGATYSVPF